VLAKRYRTGVHLLLAALVLSIAAVTYGSVRAYLLVKSGVFEEITAQVASEYEEIQEITTEFLQSLIIGVIVFSIVLGALAVLLICIGWLRARKQNPSMVLPIVGGILMLFGPAPLLLSVAVLVLALIGALFTRHPPIPEEGLEV